MHLPGVIGGESERLQSPFAKLSAHGSASRHSLTTSYGWNPKYGPSTGVGRGIELEGGLLIVLPEVDSGGVDGEYEDAMQYTFVSNGRSDDVSCLKAIEGFN